MKPLFALFFLIASYSPISAGTERVSDEVDVTFPLGTYRYNKKDDF